MRVRFGGIGVRFLFTSAFDSLCGDIIIVLNSFNKELARIYE